LNDLLQGQTEAFTKGTRPEIETKSLLL